MTKVEDAKFLATLDEFSSAEAQDAIGEYLVKHDKQPKAKVEVKKAVKKAVASKPAKTAKVDAPAYDISTAEDAPF